MDEVQTVIQTVGGTSRRSGGPAHGVRLRVVYYTARHPRLLRATSRSTSCRRPSSDHRTKTYTSAYVKAWTVNGRPGDARTWSGRSAHQFLGRHHWAATAAQPAIGRRQYNLPCASLRRFPSGSVFFPGTTRPPGDHPSLVNYPGPNIPGDPTRHGDPTSSCQGNRVGLYSTLRKEDLESPGHLGFGQNLRNTHAPSGGDRKGPTAVGYLTTYRIGNSDAHLIESLRRETAATLSAKQMSQCNAAAETVRVSRIPDSSPTRSSTRSRGPRRFLHPEPGSPSWSHPPSTKGGVPGDSESIPPPGAHPIITRDPRPFNGRRPSASRM